MGRKSTVDYLIIGQGIAGSLLGYALLQKGLNVRILDNGHRNSASKVAAGLINPITGKRLVLSWQIEAFLPKAIRTYSELSAQFGKNFFIPKPIVRFFQNEDEIKRYERRLQKPEYRTFLGQRYQANHWQSGDSLGSFEITHGGYLATGPLLSTLKAYFIEQGVLEEAEFKVDAIDATQRVIFCEGYRSQFNPLFEHLPFNCAKGDILTLQAEGIASADPVFLKGKWIIPQEEDGLCKLGATYAWEQLDEIPSAKGKGSLLGSLKDFMPQLGKVEVIDHRAGVRPSTQSNRPFLGGSPMRDNAYIFGGMGSKGCLWAPLLAEHLVAHIESGHPLWPEVDIKQYPS